MNASFLNACQIAVQKSQLNIQIPSILPSTGDINALLETICRQSNLIYRQIRLKEGWWQTEGLPMVAFFAATQKPIAIYWKNHRYVYIEEGEEREIKPIFGELYPIAYTFYKALPESTSMFRLAKFCMQGNSFLFLQLLVLGSIGAIIGLFSPFMFSYLFDHVIPGMEYGMLVQILLALLAIAFCTSIFGIVRDFILLRLEGLLQSRLDVALWDRLFKLPIHFFRRYGSGDLIQRVNVIDRLRQSFGGTMLQTVVSTVLSIFYLFPMFYFSWELATIALSTQFLSVLISLFVLAYSNRLQRIVLELLAQINQFLTQVVRGIDKIRIAGAENRAIFHWHSLFHRSQQTAFQYGKVQNAVGVVSAILFGLSTFLVYATVILFLENKDSGFTLGHFMAFNAAYMVFSQSLAQFLAVYLAIMAQLPSWDRGKVIMHEPVEEAAKNETATALTGEVHVDSVSFKYEEDSPWILKNIQLSIRPGEFIGIAGPSGCGKSTLLRLLIGLENPQQGNIYYQNQNIQKCDLIQLRREMGVVMQSSAIFSGSIYDNILCGRKASTTEIEEALRCSCFDDVLKELPMGLDTPLPSGGNTLSGGQKQRLLLARALLFTPRMLLLDEATSALDSQTELKVICNISKLNITRIAVAHRLDTIKDADRIYFMHEGEIVESGTFQELLKREGHFSKQAHLQQL
jgi:ATP-binding cassette subfamily C protein